MTAKWMTGTCVCHLPWPRRRASLLSRVCLARHTSCRAHTWNRGVRSWLSRLSLEARVVPICTSVAHRSADANLSRLKSTLDSVSKAVSSRMGVFKSSSTSAAGPPPGADRKKGEGAETAPEADSEARKSKEASNAALTSSSVISAPSTEMGLFHPAKLPASLDETYTYLAHHVNAYFGSKSKSDVGLNGKEIENKDFDTDKGPADLQTGQSSEPSVAPPAPTSPKKGLSHYLSYPGPSMQAFVGSYITPLVPKFRPSYKGDGVVKDKLVPVQEVSPDENEMAPGPEQKTVEDKARRLLLQREKIIARVSVDNRTRAMIQALQRASDVKLYISRVEDLSYHLLEFPETRVVAVKEKVIPCLLRLREAGDPTLQAAVREALALVGYCDPVSGRGIRLLSIDGGGTRGLVALQTLRKLEDLTGKQTYQLFDYICGVSTGAILAFMLGVFQIPLGECEELYRRLGNDVFKQNVILGTVKMGWSHAFYDCQVWEAILKDRMGCDLMVETARNPKCPKVAAVSTIVNRGTPLKPYVFRNYNLLPGMRSHYRGSCQHKLWQAIRASSAAPGYFQEFGLGNDLHQDGGLLVNNPTALALHESQCLWPGTPVQCVVSLGTGRYESSGCNSTTYTSLKTKLTNVISSATDTEEVHSMLDALLPADSYFRFNPMMTEDIPLDESRVEKLAQLQAEGARYLERNENKLRRAARVLAQKKSTAQKLGDWVKLRVDMYQGLTLVPRFKGP